MPGGPILAVLAFGLLGTLAWVASGVAGPAQGDGPSTNTTPAPSEPGGPSPAARHASADVAAETEPAWETDVEKGLKLAAAKERPALLRFTAQWCPPCQVMDRSVFPDREVKAALAERVVPVELDIDEERNAELALRYGVRGVPTLLLVDAEGTVLARGGFMSAEALVRFLRGT